MANVLLQGTVLTGAGVAVVGATVEVFDRNTTTPVRATFTGGTDASGNWNFSYAPGANSRRVDVRITNGTSISFLKYDDQIQVSSVETANLRIINPALTFEYDIVPAAITAARQMNLPLLTGTGTFAVLEDVVSGGQTFAGAVTFSRAGGAAVTISGATGNTLVVDTNVLIVDATNNRVGVNVTAPAVSFHIVESTTNDFRYKGDLSITLAGAVVAGQDIYFRKARGTITAPTAALASDNLAELYFLGYQNGAYRTAAAIIVSATTGWSDVGTDSPGHIIFQTTPDGSNTLSERARITDTGNVKIAGTANRATTEGTNHLDIFNGTSPAGTLANGVSLYSSAGELNVMDAGGTATLLSPHDDDGFWIFDSRDTRTGRHLRIHMEKFMRKLEEHFGWGFIEEFMEGSEG